jgi:hypothetical protein
MNSGHHHIFFSKFHLQDMLHDILGDDHGKEFGIVAFVHCTGVHNNI